MKLKDLLKENIYKALNETNGIQRYAARRYFFRCFEKLGFHITGDHFYELIPNTTFVKKHYSDKPRELDGLKWNLSTCEKRALGLIEKYGNEFQAKVQKYGFCEENIYFRGLDALILYAVVRDLKPHKIVEIGQGCSTRVILAALDKVYEESGTSCEFISVDPYARLTSQDTPAGVRFGVIQEEVQRLDPNALLSGCDFLFVDSTHVYKFGSDVEFEFCNLYGKISKGTLIHFHDIYSPYEYPLDWIVDQKRFWNEQYILENFLRYNSDFEIHLPLQLLVRRSESLIKIAKQLPLDPHFLFNGASFYIKRN